MHHTVKLGILLLVSVLCAFGSSIQIEYTGTGLGSTGLLPAVGGQWVGDDYRITDISVSISGLAAPHAGLLQIELHQLEVEGLFNTALDSAILFDGRNQLFDNHRFAAGNTYIFADSGGAFNRNPVGLFQNRDHASGIYAPETSLDAFFNNTTRGFWLISISNLYLFDNIAEGWTYTITINAVQDVPEPASVALAGIGLAVLGIAGHRARRRRQPAA